MAQSARDRSLTRSTLFIIRQHLWAKIVIGMVLGITLGLLLSPEGAALITNPDIANNVASWIKLPGTIFLGLLQMVVVPLIFCSIILGITDTDNAASIKRLSLRLIPYFVITAIIAITLGVFIVGIMQPGAYIDVGFAQATIASGIADNLVSNNTLENLSIPDRIANLIPANPARASLERDMLQIVIAAILIGLALISIAPKNGKPFKDLCLSVQMLSMKIVSWAMIIAPYAVFGLLCDLAIRVGVGALTSVAVYMIAVLTGLILLFILYCLIVKYIARYPIRQFLSGSREVLLLAFSTSSSAATMPFTIKATEENLNVPEEITRFVIPLGTTVNMDGTAIYQVIAALFLCQVFGVELTTTETIIVIFTTLGASIGTPAMPGVGIVVLATILIGVGVPPTGIAIILGVDRILDMCRTVINVTGDITASLVMQQWLEPQSKKINTAIKSIAK